MVANFVQPQPTTPSPLPHIKPTSPDSKGCGQSRLKSGLSIVTEELDSTVMILVYIL